MPHGKIVFFCYFFLILFELYIVLPNISIESLFPTSLKLGLRHDSVVLSDSCSEREHRRISVSVLNIDFSHIPLKRSLIVLWEVDRNDL